MSVRHDPPPEARPPHSTGPVAPETPKRGSLAARLLQHETGAQGRRPRRRPPARTRFRCMWCFALSPTIMIKSMFSSNIMCVRERDELPASASGPVSPAGSERPPAARASARPALRPPAPRAPRPRVRFTLHGARQPPAGPRRRRNAGSAPPSGRSARRSLRRPRGVVPPADDALPSAPLPWCRAVRSSGPGLGASVASPGALWTRVSACGPACAARGGSPRPKRRRGATLVAAIPPRPGPQLPRLWSWRCGLAVQDGALLSLPGRGPGPAPEQMRQLGDKQSGRASAGCRSGRRVTIESRPKQRVSGSQSGAVRIYWARLGYRRSG